MCIYIHIYIYTYTYIYIYIHHIYQHRVIGYRVLACFGYLHSGIGKSALFRPKSQLFHHRCPKDFPQINPAIPWIQSSIDFFFVFRGIQDVLIHHHVQSVDHPTSSNGFVLRDWGYDTAQKSERDDFILDFRRSSALRVALLHRRMRRDQQEGLSSSYMCQGWSLGDFKPWKPWGNMGDWHNYLILFDMFNFIMFPCGKKWCIAYYSLS